jgi:DNA polymerase-1
MESEIERLTKEIYREAGREFNIASPMQLGEVFEQLNYEVSKRTSTGKIATGRDVLDELAIRYTLPRLIIEHRELSKLKGNLRRCPAGADRSDRWTDPHHAQTDDRRDGSPLFDRSQPAEYSDPDRDGTANPARLHSRRWLSCSSADYSQIELRLLAHVTRDPVMLEAFRCRRGYPPTDGPGAVFRARTPEELREAPRRQDRQFRHRLRHRAVGLAQRVGISTL